MKTRVILMGLGLCISAGVIGVKLYPQSDRKPARFSDAELEYAEDFFINKTKDVSDLSVQPLWKDSLEEEKKQPHTFDQQFENQIQEQYDAALLEVLKEQGKEPEKSDFQKNMEAQGEAFRTEALNVERQKQLNQIREEAYKQGYKVIVDEHDENKIYFKEID